MASPHTKPAKPKTKTVTIIVNNREVEVPDKEVAGLEIKTAAGVPSDFHLYGPDGDEIANDETIKVHNKQRFTAISGQDVS